MKFTAVVTLLAIGGNSVAIDHEQIAAAQLFAGSDCTNLQLNITVKIIPGSGSNNGECVLMFRTGYGFRVNQLADPCTGNCSSL
jgi:hypothetical protein